MRHRRAEGPPVDRDGCPCPIPGRSERRPHKRPSFAPDREYQAGARNPPRNPVRRVLPRWVPIWQALRASIRPARTRRRGTGKHKFDDKGRAGQGVDEYRRSREPVPGPVSRHAVEPKRVPGAGRRCRARSRSQHDVVEIVPRPRGQRQCGVAAPRPAADDPEPSEDAVRAAHRERDAPGWGRLDAQPCTRRSTVGGNVPDREKQESHDEGHEVRYSGSRSRRIVQWHRLRHTCGRVPTVSRTAVISQN